MGDPTTCVYQFFLNKEGSDGTQILQFFMSGLGLCIKLNSCADHMFYTCSFSHNIALPIAMKNENDYLYLNAYTTMFS